MNSAGGLASAAVSLSALNPKAERALHPKQVRRIVELAFMGVLSSWEDFVEAIFVRYLAGAKSSNGYKPSLRLGPARTVLHAYQVLAGDPTFDPSTKYTKFSDVGWTVAQAKLYFESGEPFIQLAKHRKLLDHAATIRNRVAHSSEKCKADFKRTALDFLAPATGKLSQGYGAGDLLMSSAQRHFGPSVASRDIPIIAAYVELYEALADALAP